MHRALAAAALAGGAQGFTCTGFDPIYTPEGPVRWTKTAAYAESVRRTNEAHANFVAQVDAFADVVDYSGRGAATSRSASVANTFKDVPIAIQPFTLDQISLPEGSILRTKQDRDLEYLISDALKPDNVLYNFHNTSGIPNPPDAQPWGGWEDPSCLLRGHFSGHWLSATSLMYNSTGNAAVKDRLDTVIAGLAQAQAALGGTPPAPGYLSGFPVQQFIDLENLVPYPKQWSPYYTIHKIMAGLRDAYILTGSAQALAILEGMASYFRHRIDAVIARGTIALWHAISNLEFGGMNEVLYDLAAITGNASYLDTAHFFDKACFLGPLALGSDDLDGMHANAHEPVVIGGARRYEVTGDAIYSDIATAFHDIVTHDHAYATGSGNHGEYWGTPGRLGDSLDGDTEESCTSYNMLKLGRHVFGWTGDVSYPDWHERLFVNGMLSTQRPRDVYGQMIYMLPLSVLNGTTKGWGDPVNTMTCCYGTGVESFAKIGDSVYYRSMDTASTAGVDTVSTASGAAGTQGAGLGQPGPHVWVSLYFDSGVAWPLSGSGAGGQTLSLNQSAQWTSGGAAAPYGQLASTINVNIAGEPSLFATISLRVPSWAQNGSAISLNGAPLPGPIQPLTWYNISKVWLTGDTITAVYPMALRVEWIRDDRPAYATTGAIMAGPWLLVAPSPATPSAVIPNGTLYGDPATLEAWIQPVSAQERNWTSLAAIPYDSSADVRAKSGSATASLRGAESGQGQGQAAGAATSGFRSGNAPSLFLRHDANSMAAVVSPIDPLDPYSGSDSQESTLVLASPGLTSQPGTVSVRATNYPSYWLCDTSALLLPPELQETALKYQRDVAAVVGGGSGRAADGNGNGAAAPAPLAFVNLPTNASVLSPATLLACTFALHSPGLTGAAGTLSLELAGKTGVYASWYAPGSSGSNGGLVSGQTLMTGSQAFYNASTWAPTVPNSPVPAFVYKTLTAPFSTGTGDAASADEEAAVMETTAVAAGGLGVVPSCPRSFLLYPIADADAEPYVSYYVFSE